MKMTNMTALALMESLSKFLMATGKTGYAIARNQRILSTELTDFNKSREALVRKYGTQDQDTPGKFTFTKQNQTQFNHGISELLNMVLDINLYQLDPADFELPYSQEANVSDYNILESFLKKKDQEKEESTDQDKNQ